MMRDISRSVVTCTLTEVLEDRPRNGSDEYRHTSLGGACLR